MARVLFICTGNYYRSRFAEALFNHLCEERGLDHSAFSRGLATWVILDGSELSPDTIDALNERSISLKLTHRAPRQLQEKDLESADRVIALKEAEHRRMMEHQFPAWADRITYWHVHDIDVAHPEEALPEIEVRVMALLEQIQTASEADTAQ
ncbi:MAG: low molecular weight phosphatase family protein [Verrucomicrobiota bacterium]